MTHTLHPLVIRSTYDPDDDKIRIYTKDRLTEEDYAKVKALKMQYAHKMGCWFGVWTYGRMKLATEWGGGEIQREDSTVEERALTRAQRFAEYAAKRRDDADAYSRAAEFYQSRVNDAQPTLRGHHSSRSADVAERRMKSAEAGAEKMLETSNYWLYRIRGVVSHANYRQRSGVIMRRIEKILKDLRTYQRRINHCYEKADKWGQIAALYRRMDEEGQVPWNGHRVSYTGLVKFWAGCSGPDGRAILTKDYYEDRLHDWFENATAEQCQEFAEAEKQAWATIDLTGTYAVVAHQLNRASYERSKLGEVPYYDGELTTGQIQTFLRKFGVEKPKATFEPDDMMNIVAGKAKIPAFITGGDETVEMDIHIDDLRSLMQSLGYEVPVKRTLPPIVNFKSEEGLVVDIWGGKRQMRQIEMTNEQYQAIYSDYRGVRPLSDKSGRARICRDPAQLDKGFTADWVTVFITDRKVVEPLEVSNDE